MTDATQTFRDNEILLIGANGFLGKVLLGLLLDRFPQFRHLHILVRPKGDLTARQRFEKEVLRSPALEAIARKAGPAIVEHKISILPGDLGQAGCGLDSEQVNRLRGRVTLIINCAGLVEFFPPVDQSFQSNVDGVENVIALTRELGAKLVHVSTCFVCGEADGLIEESEPILGFYPRRQGPQDHSFRHKDEIRFMRERVAEAYASARVNGRRDAAKELAQKLTDLGRQRAAQWGWVNTYTYAKSLGEQLIAAEEGLDYAILRPSIVEAAVEFPFPGWVEGGRTAAPLVMMAMGGLRHWPIREDLPLEVVPVDQVAASILATSVLLLNGSHRRVYQLGTAEVNPVRMGALVRLLHEQSRVARRRNGKRGISLPQIPAGVRVITPAQAKERRIRLQSRLVRLQRFVVGMRKMVQKAGLPGRRPLATLGMGLRALSLQALIREQTLELYQPFVLDNRFIFESENMRSARELLSEADRQLLPWTPERIDWRRYWIHNEIQGIQKWVVPETAQSCWILRKHLPTSLFPRVDKWPW